MPTHRFHGLNAVVILAFFGVATALPAAEPEDTLVWFGTYTGTNKKGPESRGIYGARFNPETGVLSQPTLAAEVQQPTFLALHPTLPRLYAVCRDDSSGKPIGAVTAFRIDTAGGMLGKLGNPPTGGPVATGGNGPCHVCVSPDGKVLLAANYGGGSVICLGLADDGSIKPVVAGTPGGFIKHADERTSTPGIDPKRQEKAHAHSVDVSPDNRFAFSCDLGLDEVLIYRLDRERATLMPHGHSTLEAGSGPRHFVMHPNGRLAWCINELSLTVTGFTYDPQAGTLTQIETVPTLTKDVVDRKGFTCAEIAVHPSGKFLYASTRGHDSITTYRINDKTGHLDFQGTEPTRAATPRHFAISPNGKFLLAAGQTSDNVTVFAIDAESGTLKYTGQSVEVPSPVCVLFQQ
jgi:6-phosphogluconolactonase